MEVIMEIQQTADTSGMSAYSTGVSSSRDASAAAPAKSVSAPAQPATSTVGKSPPTDEQVLKAMDAVQKVVTTLARDVRFSIDKDTGRTIVKVIDMKTDTVLRQFPSEEILAIAKALDKFQGLLVQQKA
jgi:flagellar protein FlaG